MSSEESDDGESGTFLGGLQHRSHCWSFYATAIWSGRREYRRSSLGFETREWSWCGAVISLDRGCNADEARSSQREDAKRRKGDEAGLSSPVVFGVLH